MSHQLNGSLLGSCCLVVQARHQCYRLAFQVTLGRATRYFLLQAGRQYLRLVSQVTQGRAPRYFLLLLRLVAHRQRQSLSLPLVLFLRHPLSHGTYSRVCSSCL